MIRARKFVALLACCLAASALLMVFASGAQAAKPVTVHCGQKITENTTLANDLTDCPNNGIIIGADNITLDLNGHTIDGDDAAAAKGCGIGVRCDAGVVNSASHGPKGHAINRPGHDGVTIENGSIQEFTNEGVFALGVRGNRLRDLTLSNNLFHGVGWRRTEESQIENVSETGSFAGIVAQELHHVQIEDSTFIDDVFSGLLIVDSDYITIARNTISDNQSGIEIHESNHNRIEQNSMSGHGFAGMLVELGEDNLVTDNHISRSGEVGLSFIGDNGTITRNRVVDTVGGCEGCGAGISFEGGTGNLIANNIVERTQQTVGIQFAAFEPETPPAIDNVARSNVVRDGGLDGILVAATATDTLLDGNLATNNADDGIDVENPATTLTGNIANQNQDLGIEAITGVIDGGGNTASGNGNPLQCTGVVCS